MNKRPKISLGLWPEGYRPSPTEILNKAIEVFRPVAMYAGFSGGNGSKAATHWMMDNTATGTCEAFHSNPGERSPSELAYLAWREARKAGADTEQVAWDAFCDCVRAGGRGKP